MHSRVLRERSVAEKVGEESLGERRVRKAQGGCVWEREMKRQERRRMGECRGKVRRRGKRGAWVFLRERRKERGER